MNEFKLSDSENSLDYEVYTRCEEIQNKLNDLMELLDNHYSKIPYSNLREVFDILGGIEDDVLLVYRGLKSLYH